MTDEEILKQIQDGMEAREKSALAEGDQQVEIKEYYATAPSKNHLDTYPQPEDPWVYKLKIEGNKLIVWGR